MNFGLKVSTPGNDVNTTSLQNLVVDTNYPFWKCDLRPKPKNYGLINFTVSSIANGASFIIYQQPHGYAYIPTFITAWNYPVGTNPNISYLNETFGIGDIDASSSSISPCYISMYVDNQNFYVAISNSSGSTSAGITGTIRFYIFADDFSGT